MKTKKQPNPMNAAIKKLPKPHPSHKVSKWRQTIVTLIATPRFGRIRSCVNCGAEQAITGTGSRTHPEFTKKCLYSGK